MSTCPSCGYCPHCGRHNPQPYYVPYTAAPSPTWTYTNVPNIPTVTTTVPNFSTTQGNY